MHGLMNACRILRNRQGKLADARQRQAERRAKVQQGADLLAAEIERICQADA